MTAIESAIPTAIATDSTANAQPKRWLFNPASASAAAAKSAASRKRNAERLKAELERHKAAATLAQPIIADAITLAADASTFVSGKLSRVRRQITAMEDLHEQMVKEGDTKRAKECCDALWRLWEIESYLSGRPKPGSRRPGREKPARESRSAAPLDVVE